MLLFRVLPETVELRDQSEGYERGAGDLGKKSSGILYDQVDDVDSPVTAFESYLAICFQSCSCRQAINKFSLTREGVNFSEFYLAFSVI